MLVDIDTIPQMISKPPEKTLPQLLFFKWMIKVLPKLCTHLESKMENREMFAEE